MIELNYDILLNLHSKVKSIGIVLEDSSEDVWLRLRCELCGSWSVSGAAVRAFSLEDSLTLSAILIGTYAYRRTDRYKREQQLPTNTQPDPHTNTNTGLRQALVIWGRGSSVGEHIDSLALALFLYIDKRIARSGIT